MEKTAAAESTHCSLLNLHIFIALSRIEIKCYFKYKLCNRHQIRHFFQCVKDLKPTWWSDPRCTPQGVVVWHPVPVLHIAVAADNFHPLWVFVNNFPCGRCPLFPQATDVQVLVFHCQPFSFERFTENRKYASVFQ